MEKKKGRPKVWNEKIEAKFLVLISTTDKGIHRLYRENDWLPSATTIFKELYENKAFAERYARAREAQAEFLADQILEIADDSSKDEEEVTITEGVTATRTNYENIQRSRLRVDARKWKASKLYPKVYGEKLDTNVNQNSKIIIEGKTTEELDDLLGE